MRRLEQRLQHGKQIPNMTARVSSSTFALASLGPAILLVVGAYAGGIYAYLGLFGITAVVLIADKSGLAAASTPRQGYWLPRLVGLSHFAVLAAGVWAIGLNARLDLAEKAALFLGMGLYFGQVSNACAHELIHRNNRSLRALGTAIYCSLLNGQHVSAHMLLHHVHAGTARDPNSAPLGQGFWRFFSRVVVREFREGLLAENKRRQTHASGLHPYAIYISGALLSLGAAYLLSGFTGLLVLLGLSAHAQMQLMLSDYLQHYGLRRQTDENGRTEPMGPHHSWNAPHAYSAALMLNAPLHSDHHMNPARAFPDLRYDAEAMPTLPRSVPVMGAIALIPPWWRKVMDPRVREYQPVDAAHHGNVIRNATPAPVPKTSNL